MQSTVRGHGRDPKAGGKQHSSRRTKHIDVKRHLVTDACDAGKVNGVYARTEDQHADMFPKLLDIHTFHNHVTTVLNVV